MKLYTLIENTTSDPALTAEHGLSLYIETSGKKLLFDTGASGSFLENARRMGVNLGAVDLAILSHGHYDHGGGIRTFLEVNDHAPVYLSARAFGEHYNASGKYIGLAPELRENPRLFPVENRLELFPGIWLDHGDSWLYPIEPYGLQVRERDALRPEEFDHELYLLVQEGERSFCFSGCAHRGVENIVLRFHPRVFVGGFHFKELQPEDERLTRAAERLLQQPCEYYTCHCTGEAQYRHLKRQMGNRLHRLSAGTVLEI